MNKKFKSIMLVAVIAIFGITTLAFAQWGMGSGHMGRGNWGPGWHHRGGYGPGYGYSGNLSADELNKLDQERTAYLQSTEGLRQDIYQKELQLRSELAKGNPDRNKVASLQKEISDIDSQLSQKGLDFELKMRKTNPNFRGGYMGRGPMMGPGPYGGSGYCGW